MTKLRGALYVAAFSVLLIFGYKWRHKHDATVDAAITSTVLPQEDKAKYIIDEKKHTISTVERDTSTGRVLLRTTYLAPKAAIEIRKDGTVKVTQRVWGTEFSPFIGIGIDSGPHGRAALGINGFYVDRWEAGGGLSLNILQAKDVRAFVHVSYNVYSNCILSIGVDNHKSVQALVGLKF